MKRRGNKSAATGENCVDPGRRGKCPLADRPTEDVIGADAACPGWISSHSTPSCPVPGRLPATRALPYPKDTMARDAIINILMTAVSRSYCKLPHSKGNTVVTWL